MPLFLPLFPLMCALDLIHISPFRDCSFFISFFFFFDYYYFNDYYSWVFLYQGVSVYFVNEIQQQQKKTMALVDSSLYIVSFAFM